MYLDNIRPIQFLPDIINLILLLLLIIIVGIRYDIKKKYLIILCISSLTPFLFYFMWHWTFLPDQSKYSNLIYKFRNFTYDKPITDILISRIDFASFLLALFPVPFVNTIVSISLINKAMLCSVIFYFIIKKYYFLVSLFLFLPSMIVISSLALRDMLVVIVGVFFCYFFIEKKNYLKSMFFLLLFFLIKPHLASLFLVISIIYFTLFVKFNLKKFKINLFSFFLILTTFFCILVVLLPNFLTKIRMGFFSELFNYLLISNHYSETVSSILFSNFYFLISPISTGNINLMNVLIFLENIFIIFVIIALLKLIHKENKYQTLYWIYTWLSLNVIIGSIIFNSGTIWRYKFTTQIILLSAMYFSIKNKKRQINLF